jgi:hypothetical protein
MDVSLSLFEKEHASKEKYIYFLCSVSSVLLAYIGKDYKPNHPFTLHDGLTLWCLGCLTGSFILGLGRINCYNHGLNLNREYATAVEGIRSVNQSILHHRVKEGQEKSRPITMGEGQEIPKAQLENEMTKLILQKDTKFKRMKGWYNASTVFIVLCHILLIAGFTLLLLSKILP